MVAIVTRERVLSLIHSVKHSAADVPTKLRHLRRLSDEISSADTALLADFLPPVLELLSSRFSPVRKFVTQMIGRICLKHLELLPEIISAFMSILKDDTPAVTRQAIACSTDILRCTLIEVATQGMYSSNLNESLKSSWSWVLKFKDEISLMALKEGSDGRRLPALKFLELLVLLYTPDPNGSLEPPSDKKTEEKFEEFNISWLRGGHPILNVGDLSVEASRSLGMLLDQLRFPAVRSLSNLMIVVLIKSLSGIAWKRPAFYGRILPVLLGLDPLTTASKGIQLSMVHHALKNAFESCLKCTHPGAAPWRDRLVSALNDIKAEKSVEKASHEVSEEIERKSLNDDSQMAQDEKKPSNYSLASEQNNTSRKRPGVHISEVNSDEMHVKRSRTSPNILEGSMPVTRPIESRSDPDNGPVQQLVAMFGALVAQGEKAVSSLEILISSISADLLAEVVIANLPNLPPACPKSEEDKEPLAKVDADHGMVGSDLKNLSSLLTDILSQSPSRPENDVRNETHEVISNALESQPIRGEDVKTTPVHLMGLPDSNDEYDGLGCGRQQGPMSTAESISPEDISLAEENGYSAVTSGVNDLEVVDNEIPGLAASVQAHGLAMPMSVPSLGPADLEDTIEDQITSLGSSLLETIPAMSIDKSEELSPKTAAMDVTSTSSLVESSVGLTSQLVLPKMSAPVIQLADEQKDNLQEFAFARIINAYKQIAVAGGSEVRFSILAHSGVEFPSDLDPWKFLQAHIFSDYINHEGHELILRVLYRLYGEAEEDRDFFSSTTATSVYEMFLLKAAETLRDSFPPSDKSLSRLLSEAPYLPKSILDMLDCMCSPRSGNMQSGDRVTQGLSTVWTLILMRPSIRETSLKIALKSAVHHLEEVRMKAIRLVANKLYPLSSIAQKIEEFAEERLLSVSNVDHTTETSNADGTMTGAQKAEKISSENQLLGVTTKGIGDLLSASEILPSSSIAEVQRCMSLYFALCTKKHSLFRKIFDVYGRMSNVVKQTVHQQIPLLARTIGSSPDLINIISDPPTGSEGLLIQVIQTLTDGTVPSKELISSVRKLYDTKVKDVEILIRILPFLPKEEVLLNFPHLVNAPLDKFQLVLSRVLQGSAHSGPVLTPAEALIAIHGIDPDKDGIPLKKITDACNACFEQREIFTQQVLAKVLNQLVEQIPLPLLFMRTVLQAIGAFPSLVDFIMEILSRLVSKQIWKYPKLWVGFVKCALLTKPQSFGVLLQLPAVQLENAVNRMPALKAPLVAHASQPHIRSTLPRSILVVLGIISESQPSNQTQAIQAQTGGTSNSDKEVGMEKSKESSTAS